MWQTIKEALNVIFCSHSWQFDSLLLGGGRRLRCLKCSAT